MSRSPFPGMDPFLEQCWRDVHHSLITYSRDHIQSQLPRELRARMEERVFVASEEGIIGSRFPDVHVEQHAPGSLGGGEAIAGAVGVAEPFVVDLPGDEITEPYIEITDAASGNRVITVIEFLSPTNKLPGPGRNDYVRKRDECQKAGVNLVEIDLTRQGPRDAVLPLESIPSHHHSTYLICVEQSSEPRRLAYYPIPLTSPLPTFRIPLRPGDKLVTLNLQAIVDQAYINGRYDDLDYQRALNPPLEPTEAAWLAEQLLARKQG